VHSATLPSLRTSEIIAISLAYVKPKYKKNV
jgi:hypothetical protein